VNEHPSDPASYTITATVPQKWQVIANGVPAGGTSDPPSGMRTFRWEQRQPIASYLTMLYIDTFTTTSGTSPGGVPLRSAFAPGPDAEQNRQLDEKTGPVVDYLSTLFGPYPFAAAGGVYLDEPISFALETATRPVYADWVDEETVVHELAHQWFGDDVMIERWSDICLNECFASYAPWLWFAKTNGTDPDQVWKDQASTAFDQPAFWRSPLVDMGPGQEFSRVYDRGPLALHALRAEIGDDVFFRMLKGWVAENAGRNVTFDEWEAYVSRLAGRDLSGFIDAWFRGTTAPPQQYRHPGHLGG